MRLAPLCALVLTALAGPAAAHPEANPADRLLHEQMLVLDTHLDTPVLFERPGWDFTRWHEPEWDNSQVDVPRMEAAGLDGGFFVIYTAQGKLDPASMSAARNAALSRAAAIQRVVAAYPEKLAFATTAADAERIHKEGKRIVFQSIENSYPLGNDVSLLQYYHRLGVRMAGPVHNGNNQFGDSARPKPDDKSHGGLSPLGRAWVAEMNRLGMIIDGSHSSDASIEQMIALSKAPIVLSHHGPKAIFDHPRNIGDPLMRRLARSGGVMFMNTLFLRPTTSSEARDSIEERQKGWETLSAPERRKLIADRGAVEGKDPTQFADFELFMRSMLHAIKVMGVDHVGLGADWDGGGGLTEMKDIVPLPLITARLRKEGLSEADITKIMSGNLLRVMRATEKQAAR
jgi:membrane dipeptidase